VISSAPAARGPDTMRRGAALLVLVVLGLLPSEVVCAQGTNPLSKAQLVQLLATGSLRHAEIAALVRRNCVTFRPTARDRADLRAVGADTAVIAAVDRCVLARVGARAPAARATAALRVVTRANVSGEAGGWVDVRVQLLRGTAPQVGVPLLLRGASAVPGGVGQDPHAVTDRRGFAHFRIPTGISAGTYPLTLVLANGEPVGPGDRIDVVVGPAPPARAVAAPAEVALGAVTVTVTDAHGNRVAGVAVELRPVTAQLAGALGAGRVTDARGQAVFALPPGSVRRGGEVGVFVRGVQIGALTLRREVLLSEARTQFAQGMEQHGAAGSPLGGPLLFEVHDTSGAPVAGQSVAFAAAGGQVEPAVAPSDSSGVVRVRVTLGERAGPVVVSAKVGAITRTATLYADPGPARELALERDGAPLTGALTVRSRDTVVVRVVARDAYGNETALTNFMATITGQAVRLKSAVATGSLGVVSLAPRRTGSGGLTIRASGLQAEVPVEVTLPGGALAGGLARGWVFGARGSWSGFTYAFKPVPYVEGRPGVRGELFAGHAVSERLRVELAAGFGSLKADSASREVSVALTQEYVRGEYALARAGTIIPVVSLGGGGFRIKSDDPRHLVYHTSFFWLVGMGLDARLSGSAIAELRVETQQLNELSSPYVNGYVGALTVVEAGVRLSR